MSKVLSFGVLAAIFALIVTQRSVKWFDERRKQRFAEYRDRSRPTIAARFRLPPIGRSSAQDQLDSLSRLPPNTHRQSRDAQGQYRDFLVSSVTCLFLAFVSLALSATSLKEFWFVELPIAWLEIIGIVLVIVYFLRARTAHRNWLKLRAAAELQRQYIYLKVVFPDLNASAIAADLASQAAVNLALIFEQIVNGRLESLISRIEAFWQTRRSALERGTLCEQDASYDRLLLYIRRRCLRQLRWFMDSHARLEREAEDRKTTLMWLYAIAVGLALSKFLVTILDFKSHDLSGILAIVTGVLLFLLLMISGISASMTAYYLNQNSRSLIHRYKSQERRLEHWCASFIHRAFDADANERMSKNEARDKILEFEDMMVEELIDWTHISFNDVIELAP